MRELGMRGRGLRREGLAMHVLWMNPQPIAVGLGGLVRLPGMRSTPRVLDFPSLP